MRRRSPSARRRPGGVRLTALLAALATLAGCGTGDDAVAGALTDALGEAARSGAPVDLAEVVGGDWERLVLVCPYEDDDVVAGRLGFSWPDFPGADTSETAALFVFATADGVATWARLPRAAGDPCGAGSPVPLVVPRADARYRVLLTDRTGDGEPFHSLRPA